VAGRFIVFEGSEGSGKSSQIRLLAVTLTGQGFGVCVTREPGGTAIGEQIRTMVLGNGSTGIAAETEALLMTAARAQHVREIIRPALNRGEIVLCDRFSDSTLAYQGGGRGLSLSELEALQKFATQGLRPDLRLLLDLPVEAGLARRRADDDTINRLDREANEFHRRVRACYLSLAKADTQGWVVIDATRDPRAVAKDVERAVVALVAGPRGS
jgi:dTMP kinase